MIFRSGITGSTAGRWAGIVQRPLYTSGVCSAAGGTGTTFGIAPTPSVNSSCIDPTKAQGVQKTSFAPADIRPSQRTGADQSKGNSPPCAHLMQQAITRSHTPIPGSRWFHTARTLAPSGFAPRRRPSNDASCRLSTPSRPGARSSIEHRMRRAGQSLHEKTNESD